MNTLPEREIIVHHAKVDRWVAAVFGGAVLLVVATGTALVAGNLCKDEPDVSLALTIAAIDMAAIVFVGMILWGCYHTRYEVTASDLIVRCGPIRTTLPLDSIVEVFPTHDLSGAPAPSLDRLQIDYRSKGWGRGFVLISPEDKEGFVRDLATAAPRLRSAGNDSLRLKAEGPG